MASQSKLAPTASCDGCSSNVRCRGRLFGTGVSRMPCDAVQDQLRKIHVAMGLPLPPSLTGTPSSSASSVPSPSNSSRSCHLGQALPATRLANHVPRPGASLCCCITTASRTAARRAPHVGMASRSLAMVGPQSCPETSTALVVHPFSRHEVHVAVQYSVQGSSARFPAAQGRRRRRRAAAATGVRCSA